MHVAATFWKFDLWSCENEPRLISVQPKVFHFRPGGTSGFTVDWGSGTGAKPGAVDEFVDKGIAWATEPGFVVYVISWWHIVQVSEGREEIICPAGKVDIIHEYCEGVRVFGMWWKTRMCQWIFDLARRVEERNRCTLCPLTTGAYALHALLLCSPSRPCPSYAQTAIITPCPCISTRR